MVQRFAVWALESQEKIDLNNLKAGYSIMLTLIKLGLILSFNLQVNVENKSAGERVED